MMRSSSLRTSPDIWKTALTPQAAALQGASEIGFTVLSISISLVAVFIPILMMGDYVGRLFREFAVTLSVAIAVSLVVSLTTTPMMCACAAQIEREPTSRKNFPGQRTHLRFDSAFLRDNAVLGFAAFIHHDSRDNRNADRDGHFIYNNSAWIFSAAGHRSNQRHAAGGSRHQLPGDVAIAHPIRRCRPERSRCDRRHRVLRRESHDQQRLDVHHAPPDRPAKNFRRAGHRALAAAARKNPRRNSQYASGAGHPHRWPRQPGAVSIHASGR